MKCIVFPAATLALLIALTGCSAGSSESAGSSDTSVGSPALPQDAGGARDEGESAGDLDAGGADSGSVGYEDAADRDVITTGYGTIVVDDPAAAADDAADITEKAGGRVDARSETAPQSSDASREPGAPTDNGSAYLTLRIPASALTATIDDIRELGDVRELSLSSSDVTAQSRDLDARIAALDASVGRLIELLETASDTKVLIELESAISDKQGELESMQAERRALGDQVAMSTLELSLISTADAPAEEPDTFWSGLTAGWDSFTGFFAGLLVTLGVLLPWIVFLALVALIVTIIVRRVRRQAPLEPGE